MKKVARMRLSQNSINEEMAHSHTTSHSSNSEPIVRTTGRIKKPKAVFDPSDNYLPRSQRSLIAGSSNTNTTSSSLERRASFSKAYAFSPIGPIESKDACVVCKKKISKRPAFAHKNPLITCQGCQRKIHKLCLKVDFEDFETIKLNYKCDQCSTCRICNDSFANSEEEVIICSKCTKYFHLTCFPTNVTNMDNIRDWKCNKCQVYIQITNGTTLPAKKIREIIGGGEPSTSEKSSKLAIEKPDEVSNNERSSTAIQKKSLPERHLTDDFKIEETSNDESIPTPEKRKKHSNHSPETIRSETISITTPSKSDAAGPCYTPNESCDDIPDVKEWSVNQVYEYFCKHFPNEAHVFKNEEIDGRSLLLLKRSDVVKKLAIKLGPSLRIYSHILKIQTQLNNHTLGWSCGL